MKKLLSSALCMEATMTDLTPFQTEVLCLLIGGNPLPDDDPVRGRLSFPGAALPYSGVVTHRC